MSKLTRAQKDEEIAKIKARRDAATKCHRDAMDQRMENYYNCLDDYSFGGICDQASSAAIRKEENRADMLIAQIENDGFITDERRSLCLFDLEGNFITDNVIRTKYGRAFLFDGKFVSLAKRAATYEKKGFKCKTRVREFKFVFTGKFSKKGNPIHKNIEVISERYEDDIDEYNAGLSYLEYMYTVQK
jgi:hypothetical protein